MCEDSDQSGRILDRQGCKVSSCGKRRLGSDYAGAQADLSLRWVHMSEGTFPRVAALIVNRAKLYCYTENKRNNKNSNMWMIA